MYVVIKQRSPGVYFALLQAPFYLNLFSFFFFFLAIPVTIVG